MKDCKIRMMLSLAFSSVHPYVSVTPTSHLSVASNNHQVIKALHSSPDQPPIRVIARLPLGVVPKSEALVDEDDPRRIVAVQQGNHLLTTFHPELTKDGRFHEYFVRVCVVPLLSLSS